VVRRRPRQRGNEGRAALIADRVQARNRRVPPCAVVDCRRILHVASIGEPLDERSRLRDERVGQSGVAMIGEHGVDVPAEAVGCVGDVGDALETGPGGRDALRRGGGKPPRSLERSSRTTRCPWSAAAIAATMPAAPPPTTMSPACSTRAPAAIARRLAGHADSVKEEAALGRGYGQFAKAGRASQSAA
jgi:hypothetical protein